MPYGRSRRPIITSDKHELTWSNLGQNASTVQSIAIVRGVAPATKDEAVASECVTGSKVFSVYFEFHFSAEVITNPKVIHWQIEIQRAGQVMPVPSTYYQNERAGIIKRGMEMLPKSSSTVFKRIFVVRVPRIYQRVRDDSKINLRYICSSTETINACGIAIYKEYT